MLYPRKSVDQSSAREMSPAFLEPERTGVIVECRCRLKVSVSKYIDMTCDRWKVVDPKTSVLEAEVLRM